MEQREKTTQVCCSMRSFRCTSLIAIEDTLCRTWSLVPSKCRSSEMRPLATMITANLRHILVGIHVPTMRHAASGGCTVPFGRRGRLSVRSMCRQEIELICRWLTFSTRYAIDRTSMPPMTVQKAVIQSARSRKRDMTKQLAG